MDHSSNRYNHLVYLVDGNNVMGQRVGWHRDKPGAQRRLLRDIARLTAREGRLARVVFDGPALDGTGDGDMIDGVQVFHARPGSDADDRIVELAAADPDRILAVTSDRELRRRLESLGIETMRSGRFRKLLDDS